MASIAVNRHQRYSLNLKDLFSSIILADELSIKADKNFRVKIAEYIPSIIAFQTLLKWIQLISLFFITQNLIFELCSSENKRDLRYKYGWCGVLIFTFPIIIILSNSFNYSLHDVFKKPDIITKKKYFPYCMKLIIIILISLMNIVICYIYSKKSTNIIDYQLFVVVGSLSIWQIIVDILKFIMILSFDGLHIVVHPNEEIYCFLNSVRKYSYRDSSILLLIKNCLNMIYKIIVKGRPSFDDFLSIKKLSIPTPIIYDVNSVNNMKINENMKELIIFFESCGLKHEKLDLINLRTSESDHTNLYDDVRDAIDILISEKSETEVLFSGDFDNDILHLATNLCNFGLMEEYALSISVNLEGDTHHGSESWFEEYIIGCFNKIYPEFSLPLSIFNNLSGHYTKFESSSNNNCIYRRYNDDVPDLYIESLQNQSININATSQKEIIIPDGHELYFHGTDLESADSICNYGIQVQRGQKSKDFNGMFQSGYYLSTESKNALIWAKKKSKTRNSSYGAVLVYALPSDWKTIRNWNGYDVPDDKWLDFVTKNRSGNPINHSYGYVYGDIYNTKTKNRFYPIMKQMCLFKNNLAKLFDKNIVYVHIFKINYPDQK